jgi:hypothetical protein
MVVHQHPRVNPPTVRSSNFFQAEQKAFPVLVILKHHLPTITTGHQVVNRYRILVSNHTRHAQTRDRMITLDKQIVEMHYLTFITSVQVS